MQTSRSARFLVRQAASASVLLLTCAASDPVAAQPGAGPGLVPPGYPPLMAQPVPGGVYGPQPYGPRPTVGGGYYDPIVGTVVPSPGVIAAVPGIASVPGTAGPPPGAAIGLAPRPADDGVWSDVRDFQFGSYWQNDQTVFAGGGVLGATFHDRLGAGGRLLVGGAANKFVDDSYHVTTDLAIAYRSEELPGTWLKAGFLYDTQGDFSKIGPTVGLLLFAEDEHPVSIDFAYAVGQSGTAPGRVARNLTALANDDVLWIGVQGKRRGAVLQSCHSTVGR